MKNGSKRSEMKEIYLISNTENNRVKNLKVCNINFLNFSLNLNQFNSLVVTSKNSIKALKFNNINCCDIEVFSIGKATTKEAMDFGFTKIYTAKNHHGNEFSYEIAPLLSDKKVIFLRAKDVVSEVDKILIKNGVDLTSFVAYENSFLNINKDKKPPINSILIFTSPSNVKGFLNNFSIDDSYQIVSIGKATTRELFGYKNVITSPFQDINECINIAKTLL